MSGRVADLIVDELLGAGVRRIYGVPGGGSNMTLIDAAAARGLRFVLAHHETGAAFMAAAEAEITGVPGVCLATVGPGVANSINGLAHCSLDRVPLLLISDRVEDPQTLHQLVDHSRLVGAVAKSSQVMPVDGARDATRRALTLALTPPLGPVHLDLAPGVAAAGANPADASSTWSSIGGGGGDTEAAVELLAGSRHPVVLAGLGARDDETGRAIRRFVRAFGVPVLCTYKAKGVLPDDDPLAFGLVTNGRHESAVLDRTDALLLAGFDQVELMPGPWRWPLPAVAIGGPATRGPLEPTVVLGGPPATELEHLGDALDARGWRAAWPGDPVRPVPPSAPDGISPAEVVSICRRLAPEETIATVDAGSHMFAATLFWHAAEPRRFLISNGLATMGYGLPAAIGAALAQDAPVVCFTGDGGLAMCAGELATAARLGVHVIVVVFNDGMLNLIKIKQEKQGRTTHGLDFAAIDWAAAAPGMGLRAEAVGTRDELAGAFIGALHRDGPTLIDVRVDASSYRELLALVRW